MTGNLEISFNFQISIVCVYIYVCVYVLCVHGGGQTDSMQIIMFMGIEPKTSSAKYTAVHISCECTEVNKYV